MRTKDANRQYPCIPAAVCLPAIFSAIAVTWLFLTVYTVSIDAWDNTAGGIGIGSFFVLLSLATSVFTLRIGAWRVEIGENKVICKNVLPKDTFDISFDSSCIAMDWHQQSGATIWWICIFQGRFPPYKGQGVSNRVNSIRIQPGFIRIMYTEEVYNALLDVLPKKQKTALISARRAAGFEKNGRIAF